MEAPVSTTLAVRRTSGTRSTRSRAWRRGRGGRGTTGRFVARGWHRAPPTHRLWGERLPGSHSPV